MDLEQRLRAGLVAPNPGATFTARVMARIGSGNGRRRGRFLLLGTVLVMGAAAAMLAWRKSEVQLHVEGAVRAVSVPEPVTREPGLDVDPDATAPVTVAPEPAAATAADDWPQFSVLVMPVQHQAEDPGQRRSVEALHAAMVGELRKVPGLTLHVQGEPQPGVDEQADYVLTITGLATRSARSGGVEFRSTDGTNTYTVTGGSRGASIHGNEAGSVDTSAAAYGSNAMAGVVSMMLNNRRADVDIEYGIDEVVDGGGADFFSSEWGFASAVSPSGRVISFNTGTLGSTDGLSWVEIRVKPQQSDASRYTFPVAAENAQGQQLCNRPDAARMPECTSPAQLAASQVEMLRLQLFPPDAGYQRRVMAHLRDASLDGKKVLQDLLPLLTGDGGKRLDAATLHALFNYVASQPADTRASVWRTLSRVTHPALVSPLVDSLRRDPDRQVRLAALANVEANFSSSPVVKSAIEDIDQGDPDAMVRAAVRGVLHGEGQWRSDVLAALHDTSLPYDARLAPIIARTPRQSLQRTLQRQNVLQEEQVMRPVISLVREHLRDPGHAQVTGDVLSMLSNVDDPAVVDLFLQLMREPSLPIQLSGPIGSWAISHQNDPRVRESLPLIQPGTVPTGLMERMREVMEKAAP